MKEVLSVTKNVMGDDLRNFIENVFMVKEEKHKKEVTIELELKELLEENDEVIIILKYDNELMNEIKLRRRKND